MLWFSLLAADFQAVTDAMRELRDLPIRIMDPDAWRPADIARQAYVWAPKGLNCLWVDYLTRLRPDAAKESRTREVGQLVRDADRHNPVRLSLATIVLGLSLLIAGCAPTTRIADPYREPAAEESQQAIFETRWQTYLNAKLSEGLQEGCQPRRIEPPPHVDYRGTVVWLHGFSACPQQFIRLAEKLAARGYRNLLPLLPGHGRAREAAGSITKDLPTSYNWHAEYLTLAREINGLIQYVDGERVIGGLSVGGVASLLVQLNSRDLYDRQLPLVPYFAGTAPAWWRAVIDIATQIPGIRQFSVHPFGGVQSCLEANQQGRAGFCNYRLKHVGALIELGDYTLEQLAQEPLHTRIQLIGVDNDTVANNDLIRRFLAMHRSTANVSACFLPADIPHAFVSRFDNPDRDMHWLNDLTAGIVDFVIRGQAFPVLMRPDAPVPLCDVDEETP